ncbi:tRNA threonylcarbamoyladenosine biosynthesis protein TsaB [Candidatus Westeberhardia cardiocondylae]|uniref:tRNA threonylcarbamoyladenosine biosynthesis protein TsaB n=1 Tax=Candidatus Westeberhardia cardiocondylae TaxID=1594731 RepID=A0A0H5BWW3_9ENTR|nr:tRNA (adenosine(37)-N6)-threonylcarbamoyltransferase complex dimerization subunit type 1 TsaB [Candidatus Westeberhardia cardiocondylae]CEN32202.1 tRNA threonylcarbamoyladenosine biosynthesis protein TsaB [Candidatus Westeberhardia cardiocondylae]
MPLINALSIDTTTKICSVSLLKKGIYFNKSCVSLNKHTKYVLKIIDQLLIEAEITINDINLLAYNRGPGAFTGIRLGINIIQSIALVANIPKIGISTLMILAQRAWKNTGCSKILTAINVKNNDIYWTKYTRKKHGVWFGEKNEKITKFEKIINLLPKLKNSWIFTGNICEKFENHIRKKLRFISVNNFLPHAKDIIPLAIKKINFRKNATEVEKIHPIYLNNI